MEAHQISPLSGPLLDRLVDVLRDDGRFVGLTLGGSAVTATMDEHSDLDLVLVCTDPAHDELLTELPALASGLGPLLGAFTGDHVGEPRLVIALYGPPLLHVDLKLVSLGQLGCRVEDGVVLWERDGAVTTAFSASSPAWPHPDPQWIEDRFWIWVHYATTKIARGELFECLDVLAFLRSRVIGPLAAVLAGVRPQGLRRIETFDPGLAERLVATLGDHSPSGCADALTATIELYRDLRHRGPARVECRSDAERAVTAFLASVRSAA
jgi:hypothetical protein